MPRRRRASRPPRAPSVTQDGESPAGGDGTVTAPDVGVTEGVAGETGGAAGSLDEAIERADAPTTGVTDTQGAQTGQQGETVPDQALGGMAGQSERMQVPQGGSLVLDLDAFGQDIYERGFRQGYLRGISEARVRMAEQMQREMRMRNEMARQRQQSATQGAGAAQQPGQTAPQAQQPQGGQQQGADASGQQTMQGQGQDGDAQMPQAALNPEATLNTDEVGPANPEFGTQGDRRQGGTVVILPPGMDVETFLRQIEQMSGG